MVNLTKISSALERIGEVVGRRGVVEGAAAEPFLRDERELYRGQAAAVVRPASTEECARVIRICGDAGIGVVPQGGNTGYCGGATPFDEVAQIVMNLSRMNRVRGVDPINFAMTVEAGAVLAEVHAAALEHDLMFPLSMGSQGSCQIGGVLSTNAGGISVVRYGTARDLILGLEVILPTGEVLSELKGLRKDNTGYDLKSLFLGAEGTLGVITAAVLKLFPEPRSRQTALLSIATPQAACDLLGRARRRSADRVVSAEYLSRASLDLVTRLIEGARNPFEEPLEHFLLLELAGAETDPELRVVLEQVLKEGIKTGEIVDGILAESGPQRTTLWELRESIPEAERRDGGSVKHDISVQISRIPEFIEEAGRVLHAIAPHRLSVFGHVGDGNLHYNVLPPMGEALEAFKEGPAEQMSSALHDLAVSLGGSFSAEHGVGVLKRDELQKYGSPAAVGLMRTLKDALDPNGIMNPGKVLG
jgi:D-lactate dehydrogenase (cytochrome)